MSTPAGVRGPLASPTAPQGGDLPAVRGVDLSVAAGEIARRRRRVGLRQVDAGEHRAAAAATQRDGHRRGAGRRPGRPDMRWGHLRALRWAEASIVFQGALHSLNPVQQHRRPDRRADPAARPESPSRRCRAQVGELLEQVGLPAARAECLPAPALRRAEAARHDRAGAGLQARADHRRRADHRARRDGAGAGAQTCWAGWSRSSAWPDADQPRPVGARDHLRPGRRDVRRPGRRAGPGRPASSPTRTPLRAALAAAFPRIGDPAARSPRRACRATRPTRATCRRAARSTALPAGDRRVLRRSTRRSARRGAPAATPPASR